MDDAIRAVAAGFTALSAHMATVPVRTSVPLGQGGVALAMPAALEGAPQWSVKLVTVAPGNPGRGLPLVSATVLLGDAATGRPLALIDGTTLTALRTGAAGGVAAKHLARRDSAIAALVGAGAQARTQLLALVSVLPVREVRVVSRDRAHAERLIGSMRDDPTLRGVALVVASPTDAVRDADVVITATGSSTPVFAGRDLAPGAHITAVGSFTPTMRELDDDALRGARIVVDQREAALAEAGELRGLGPADVVEIGEVIDGTVPGRRTPSERTIFKSVGNAVQDLVVAARVYERARELGLGEEIAWP
jgi:alanine dehydrogenase